MNYYPDNHEVNNIIKCLISNYFGQNSRCVQVFENWKKIETLFYASSDDYRDHILHSFNTFLLGLSLCADISLFDIHRCESINDKNYDWFTLSIEDKLLTWQIVSFYHDIGYPIQRAGSIGKYLREKYFNFTPQFSVSDLSVTLPQRSPSERNEDCISEITKGYLKDTKFIHARGHYNLDSLFQESLYNTDHGIVSSYMLWQVALLDRRIKIGGEDPKIKNILRFCCEAMALHTIYNKEYYGFLPIDIKIHPLTILLILCDELQEWDRPYSSDYFGREVDFRGHYDNILHFKSIEATGNLGKLEINVITNDEASIIEDKNKKYSKLLQNKNLSRNQISINVTNSF